MWPARCTSTVKIRFEASTSNVLLIDTAVPSANLPAAFTAPRFSVIVRYPLPKRSDAAHGAAMSGRVTV